MHGIARHSTFRRDRIILLERAPSCETPEGSIELRSLKAFRKDAIGHLFPHGQA